MIRKGGQGNVKLIPSQRVNGDHGVKFFLSELQGRKFIDIGARAEVCSECGHPWTLHNPTCNQIVYFRPESAPGATTYINCMCDGYISPEESQ